jgi:hypothetical protein
MCFWGILFGYSWWMMFGGKFIVIEFSLGKDWTCVCNIDDFGNWYWVGFMSLIVGYLPMDEARFIWLWTIFQESRFSVGDDVGI